MAEAVVRELVKHIANLEVERPLATLNPLRVGGVADYFTTANDVVQVATAVKAALDAKIPYIVLGQGSSILPADGGFPGLVICNNSSAFQVAADKSQVVVDAGISLDRLITMAASRSLGGLTHLYGLGGSLGGALYANVHLPSGPSLASFARYVTVLVPPARIDREATVARYQSSWLTSTNQEFPSKLAQTKSTQLMGASESVLLTVVLQLTSLRQEEVQGRLASGKNQLPKEGMRMFLDPLSGPASADELLKSVKADRLTIEGLAVSRAHPSMVVPTARRCEAGTVWTVAKQLQQQVFDAYGVTLPLAIERIGAW